MEIARKRLAVITFAQIQIDLFISLDIDGILRFERILFSIILFRNRKLFEEYVA